jgi:hypothetical protein
MNRSGRMHRSRRINFRGGRRSTWCLGGAPVVAEEIAGDAKEIAAGFHFAVAGRGGAEETDVAFLHEVVGEGGVAGDSGEIGPEGTGGTLVEGGKSFTIHGGLRGLRCVADRDAGENEVPVHEKPRKGRWEIRVMGVMDGDLPNR